MLGRDNYIYCSTQLPVGCMGVLCPCGERVILDLVAEASCRHFQHGLTACSCKRKLRTRERAAYSMFNC